MNISKEQLPLNEKMSVEDALVYLNECTGLGDEDLKLRYHFLNNLSGPPDLFQIDFLKPDWFLVKEFEPLLIRGLVQGRVVAVHYLGFFADGIRVQSQRPVLAEVTLEEAREYTMLVPPSPLPSYGRRALELRYLFSGHLLREEAKEAGQLACQGYNNPYLRQWGGHLKLVMFDYMAKTGLREEALRHYVLRTRQSFPPSSELQEEYRLERFLLDRFHNPYLLLEAPKL